MMSRIRTVDRRFLAPFQQFVGSESGGGLVLILAALVALVWANSPLSHDYEALKHLSAGISVGGFVLKMSLLHWVNDGLMSIFFLLVGLEIKREVLAGELKNPRAAALPLLAAGGGMLIPALIYVWAGGGGAAARGFGVPMATDIAFALGVMALLGKRIPTSLKVFLTALAIIDDLGTVLVIAVFYRQEFSLVALLTALAFWLLALGYGRIGGRNLLIYILLGLLIWYFTLISGVHATVAGILLAFAMPMGRKASMREVAEQLSGWITRGRFEEEEVRAEDVESLALLAQSPMHRLEHLLEPWMAYAVLPLFALFNAGVAVSYGGLSMVTLGVFLGLLLGKPLGILLSAWLAVRLGLAELPAGVGWSGLAGAGVLGGIGFTMSIFVAGLAFSDPATLDQAKLGVLAASVIAGGAGFVLLAFLFKRRAASN